MPFRPDQLDARVAALLDCVARLRSPPRVAEALARFSADAAALRFHLRDTGEHPLLLAVLGGTGTGKSTLINRIVNADVCAASFRRTYTAGAVAVARNGDAVPEGWLGLQHRPADSVPARGQVGALTLVAHAADPATPPDTPRPLQALTLVDTPDLDGDQPLHHGEADRAFRWAQAVLFLVTPEKYQMTELLAYYRLAQRYQVPAIFVMNKCEDSAVLEDYATQLAARGFAHPPIYAIARDDAGWEPPADHGLEALRQALAAVASQQSPRIAARRSEPALALRAADLVERLRDHILGPLRSDRRLADQLTHGLRALQTAAPGLDVSPLTQQLQRRLQEQSVLYLMGPERMLQRVRQVPGMLLRLPRTLWDVVFRGEGLQLDSPQRSAGGGAPDFPTLLADQFRVIQSRMEDLVRSSPDAARWAQAADGGIASARIDADASALIAHEELAALKQWLEQRWTAAPRDTMLLQKLLRYLPGGRKLAAWSEAAPYLLAIVVATHHAFFGPIDLLIVGGFSLATWLGEKLSNEVTRRTRHANRRIAERFEQLARQQIDRYVQWLEAQAPPARALDEVEQAATRIQAYGNDP